MKKIVKKTSKVTSKTTLEKIVGKKGAEDILNSNGVPCLSCPMAKFELGSLEIGKVCDTYDLDLKKILKELNSAK